MDIHDDQKFTRHPVRGIYVLLLENYIAVELYTEEKIDRRKEEPRETVNSTGHSSHYRFRTCELAHWKYKV